MVLTRNSGLVKIWAQKVRSGEKTLEEVPKLYNLRDVVTEITEEENATKDET